MKVTITEDGYLTVAPENGLEAYALKRWHADYGTQGSEHPSGLCIETEVDEEENKSE